MTETTAGTCGGVRSAEIVSGRLHLFLNNNFDALDDGRRYVLRFFEPENLPPSVVGRVDVIFEEVVFNIIKHGFQPNSNQMIFIQAYALPTALQLVFEDDGTPFDPLSVPPPPRFQSIETAKVGGLGVHLVTSFSMNAEYQCIPPGESVRVHEGRRFCPNNRLTLSVAKT